MDISDSSYIDDLEQEIRYLHELLDINGIPYDYQAYKDSLVTAGDSEIEFPELTREHAIEFYALGIGRQPGKEQAGQQ